MKKKTNWLFFLMVLFACLLGIGLNVKSAKADETRTKVEKIYFKATYGTPQIGKTFDSLPVSMTITKTVPAGALAAWTTEFKTQTGQWERYDNTYVGYLYAGSVLMFKDNTTSFLSGNRYCPSVRMRLESTSYYFDVDTIFIDENTNKVWLPDDYEYLISDDCTQVSIEGPVTDFSNKKYIMSADFAVNDLFVGDFAPTTVKCTCTFLDGTTKTNNTVSVKWKKYYTEGYADYDMGGIEVSSDEELSSSYCYRMFIDSPLLDANTYYYDEGTILKINGTVFKINGNSSMHIVPSKAHKVSKVVFDDDLPVGGNFPSKINIHMTLEDGSVVDSVANVDKWYEYYTYTYFLNDTNPIIHNLTDTVKPNTIYKFTIKSYDFSDTQYVFADSINVYCKDKKVNLSKLYILTGPAKPTINSISIGSNGATLTWKVDSNAKSYQLIRKTSNSEKTITITDISSDTLSYTDTTIVAGVEYSYYLYAKGSARYNDTLYLESTSQASLVKKTAIVGATSITAVKNVLSGVELTWSKPTGATKYQVFRKTVENGVESSWSWLKDVTTTTYTDKTVKSGKTYIYTVIPFVGSVKGNLSAEKTIARVGTTKITSTINQIDGVTINWNKTTNATKYMVYRRTVGNGWTTGWTWLKDVKSTSCLDKTAEDGKTYDYLIIPYMGKYKGVASDTYRHVKVPTPKVTVSKQSNGIKISYGKIANTTKYQVFRKTIGNGWETGWTWLKDTTSLSYTDTTAKAGTTYVYAVKAITPNGQSAVGTSEKIKR